MSFFKTSSFNASYVALKTRAQTSGLLTVVEYASDFRPIRICGKRYEVIRFTIMANNAHAILELLVVKTWRAVNCGG